MMADCWDRLITQDYMTHTLRIGCDTEIKDQIAYEYQDSIKMDLQSRI